MIQTTTLFDHVIKEKVPYGDEIVFLLECGEKSGDPSWAEARGMSSTVRKFLEEHPHLRTDQDVLEFLTAFSLGFNRFRFSHLSLVTSEIKEAQRSISDKYSIPYDEIREVPVSWFSVTCQYLLEHFKEYLV